MEDVIVENGKVIHPLSYEEKMKEVVEKLDNELFGGLTQENTTIVNQTTGTTKKVSTKKNEILPMLTTMQVATRLNEYLRIYRPLTLTEVKTLSSDDLMTGFNYFMQLISHINHYIVFIPDKQLVSAFLGITTNSYNELMQDRNFSEIFASIEDYLVSMNFVASQSGLAESKTTMAKLQTQGSHGHSLVKSADSITLIQNNVLDKKAISDKLQRFKAMIGDKTN